jgi:predicted anti-sigma-YlaC factor YlaD
VTHPLEHLAPYVDGTLAPSERAVVDEHVRSCARCRGELAAAQAAREELRSLPFPAGPDLAASSFTPARVAQLSRGVATRSPWAKVAPALAAAAVVALAAIVVPRLGTSSDDAGSAGVEAADTALTPAGPVRLALDETDYDVASLQEVATGYAAALAAELGAPAAGTTPAGEATAGALSDEPLRYAGRARSAKATRCLRRAFPGFPGELVAARLAGFEGTPAYLGFVLERPSPALPPDTLSIWVASVRDCSILSITSADL